MGHIFGQGGELEIGANVPAGPQDSRQGQSQQHGGKSQAGKQFDAGWRFHGRFTPSLYDPAGGCTRRGGGINRRRGGSPEIF